MTDEQVEMISEAIRESRFQDDMKVALVSGLIILIASSVISYYFSKKESKDAKEEMLLRISAEKESDLKAKREFYLEQTKMNDLALLEQLYFNYEKLFQKMYNAILFSMHSGDFDQQLAAEIAHGLVKYPNQIAGIVTTYSDVFGYEDLIKVDDCTTGIEAIAVMYVNPYVDEWQNKLLEQKEPLAKLSNEIHSIMVMIRIKRFEEYEKMKAKII